MRGRGLSRYVDASNVLLKAMSGKLYLSPPPVDYLYLCIVSSQTVPVPLLFEHRIEAKIPETEEMTMMAEKKTAVVLRRPNPQQLKALCGKIDLTAVAASVCACGCSC